MNIWGILNWGFLGLIILGVMAGAIYFCTVAFGYLFADLAARASAKVNGLCPKCGMARALGHWPGCDYWKGEKED
jgi:hypothetical protein